MARLAIVGYEPTVSFLASFAADADHVIVHKEEHYRRAPDVLSIDERVKGMLVTQPQLLHYTNFYDQHSGRRDREYLLLTKDLAPSIPILLTTSTWEGREFARRNAMYHLEVNAGNIKDYVALLERITSLKMTGS